MKKKIFYISIFLLFIILAGYNYRQYIPGIPSPFAKYHNTGNITVVADGERINVNGFELNYKSETGKIVESLILDNGEF